MTKIEEIEKAVSALAPRELAEFRAWFDRYAADKFDRQIESDAAAGKLDGLAAAALREFKAGRTRNL